jgi:arylsulfatase A-like enzyme
VNRGAGVWKGDGRSLLWLGFAAAIALAVGATWFGRAARHRPQATPTRPNIVLITLDTVRYDETPASPASVNPMPFFSRLVHSGVNFTNTYSSFDSTPESHFSMFTGFHFGFTTALDAKELSVPYQLGKLGYHTFGVAANGNLSQKSVHALAAFDRFTCLMDVWNAMPPDARAAPLARIDPALDAYGLPPSEFNRLMRFSSAGEVVRRFKTEVESAEAPFLGFMNVVDAHDPYVPDPRHYDAADMERQWDHRHFNPDLRARAALPEIADPTRIADQEERAVVVEALTKTSMTSDYRVWGTTFDLSDDMLRIYRSRYRAAVRQLDPVLRDVFLALEQKGVLDSTIVIIASDHGEAFGEQHLITHSFLNRGDREATNRVPLVFVFPPAFGFGGRTVTSPVVLSDIAPTIYDLAGLDWTDLARQSYPGNFGKSLLPLLGVANSGVEAHRIAVEPPSESADERARARAEVERRLKALGYINK